ILRKPGRFTPEEYEVMKTHSPEGAKILEQILNDVTDKSLEAVAINVAHYHHERWDGKGYPNGLKGDDIPLESRIMAIADVYDALVSKRVYKDEFSFDDANRIIMENMGKQFDPSLEKYFVRARSKIEKYYIYSRKQ
ncbi:MAG: HD domain-containing protein, partial [Bacilli bacterium]|nr:HD domain-containing protein [Bacilli bacterium]